MTTQAVEQLLDQAYAALEEGNADQAVALGNQLLEHRHARGFEVIALAYELQGRYQEAIDVLKDGVSKVPGAWPLWELLGNLYSDSEETAEAHKAYQKASQCQGADTDSINYNYAILLKRENKFDQAWELTDKIQSGELTLKVQTLRLSLLRSMRRYEEAVQQGNRIIGEILGQEDLPEESMQELARTYAELGRAYWEGKGDRQLAWENAWKALEWDRADPGALWLVREIIGRKAAGSHHWKLIVEGRWHFPLEPDKPPPGFITTYEVVAETPETALVYAQDLEPVEVRQSMKLDNCEDMGAAPDENQGVYWRSGYGFYMK